ncbi:MAG: hypothetical protein C0490_27075, partial [Marivirga sp.]|nr:hypothetical protein [Marivirga sp.]
GFYKRRYKFCFYIYVHECSDHDLIYCILLLTYKKKPGLINAFEMSVTMADFCFFNLSLVIAKTSTRKLVEFYIAGILLNSI